MDCARRRSVALKPTAPAVCWNWPITRRASTSRQELGAAIAKSTIYRELAMRAGRITAAGTARALEVLERSNLLNLTQTLFVHSLFRRTEMIIKDLEISKELSRNELAGVRGGSAFATAGGQAIVQGPSVGSPIFAVNAPTATANDNDLRLSLKSALVQGSFGTLVVQ